MAPSAVRPNVPLAYTCLPPTARGARPDPHTGKGACLLGLYFLHVLRPFPALFTHAGVELTPAPRTRHLCVRLSMSLSKL